MDTKAKQEKAKCLNRKQAMASNPARENIKSQDQASI
jgi:hypothetical protein